MGLLWVASATLVASVVTLSPAKSSSHQSPPEAWTSPPGAHRYHHERPSPPVALVSWLDDVDPTVRPPAWSSRRPLSISAAPGEREPVAFTVYGDEVARRLDIGVGALHGPVELPREIVAVKRVRRVEARRHFNRPATEIVGRFVTEFVPQTIGPGEFAEIWVELRVPPDAPPGVYRAPLRIRLGARTLERTIRLRVRPIELRASTRKSLAVYYRMVHVLSRPDGDRRAARELADMREHGIAHLVVDLRPFFVSGDPLRVDTRLLERGLALIEDAGFGGTVVFDSGLVPLALRLGFRGFGYAQGGTVDLDPNFDAAATEVLERLEALRRSHPNLELALMHLDEIFDRRRLDGFIRLAKLTREAVSLPTYATFSTLTPGQDDLRRLIDPFVDVRSHHGYSFEWWLVRGGTMQSYAEELRRSGDRAWYYHNERGTYFTARWARLVNGLYLWAGPFETHVTWTYQQFDGSPLDDTDGSVHDFGLAFPNPSEPDVLIPTRSWEALAEGYDDLRYLVTLEVALERYGSGAPRVAQEAAAFLAELKRDLRSPPTGIDPAGLDEFVGTPREAPFVRAAAQRYDGPRLDWIRERCEELTRALVASGRGRAPDGT